ncbi:unnamed protein product [Orchesella dallaii]|uniref:Ras-related protein Rab-18 n=1 Tax=Orchesella dallaii TaxID=48710 RepID=A0ABP1PW38_9HEXA
MMLRTMTFKYVVVGDSGVGKSCLINQFTETQKEFQEVHLTTIGVNLAEVTRSLRINGCEIKIQVWDTGGMEVYRSLTTAYYRNTAITLLVYDVTRRKTFEGLVNWLNEIKTSSNNPHMITLIVGNKIDLVKDRQVTRQEGQQFASQNKLFFMETSAKIRDTVDKVFFLTARVYYEKIDMGDIDIHNRPAVHGIKVGDEEERSEIQDENLSVRQRYNCSC